MPAPLAKTFHGTFVASFPGTNTSWVLIGLLEALVFVVILASVLTGEFLPTRPSSRGGTAIRRIAAWR